MRLNAGVIVEDLAACKEFYTHKLDFQILWESDWYLLLATPNGNDSISFLKANHPSQAIEQFKSIYQGAGVYFTIEVEDVDSLHAELRKKELEFALELTTEDWGDRHFAIVDPNNIGIDFVTHHSPG